MDQSTSSEETEVMVIAVTKTSSRCEVLNNAGCSVDAPIPAVLSELANTFGST